jgi:type VI secretion system protein ImpM
LIDLNLKNKPGFYGKIPARGDFVSKGLTHSFLATWDQWLQSALITSKEQLGDQWLDFYLTGPIWHFVLSAGICDRNVWAGILMPSVDAVGRYFPFTVATAVNPNKHPAEILQSAIRWFEQMERLALKVVEDKLDLNELAHELSIRTFERLALKKRGNLDSLRYRNKEGRLSFYAALKRLENVNDALAHLGFCLLDDMQSTYSIWKTDGDQEMSSGFRIYSNLPPRDAFFELLTNGDGFKDGPTEEPVDKIIPNERLSPSIEEAYHHPLAQDSNRISLAEDIYKIPSTEAYTQIPAAEDNDPTITLTRKEPSTIGSPWIQWRSFGATTVGKRRNINQDAYLSWPQIGLWVVADGMGGHSAGEKASMAVIEAFGILRPTGNLESFKADAVECLGAVNENLFKQAQKFGDGRIIGTTVVVMLAVAERCAVIWAGDSRLYCFREGKLAQLTSDHSLANSLSHQEAFLSDKVKRKKNDHIVTRALGVKPKISFDSFTFKAQADDLYLLCSDGLIKEVRHREITASMQQGECRAIAQELIRRSLDRGARDNVTVVVSKALRSK